MVSTEEAEALVRAHYQSTVKIELRSSMGGIEDDPQRDVEIFVFDKETNAPPTSSTIVVVYVGGQLSVLREKTHVDERRRRKLVDPPTIVFSPSGSAVPGTFRVNDGPMVSAFTHGALDAARILVFNGIDGDDAEIAMTRVGFDRMRAFVAIAEVTVESPRQEESS